MAKHDAKQLSEEFGDYDVYGRLGMGGMATVHRAIHRESGRCVAIKRLLPQFAKDRELIQQFKREGEIACALTHPNIVEVWDHGKVGSIHYMVMELIEGKSLLSLLRRANEDGEPAPIGVSVHMLREILKALEYAVNGLDSSGKPFNIIHRDLSPSNIIVTESGRLKIIDFGVARSTHGRYATNSGHVKGKLGYMSPEILGGRIFDGRSDLFSASVVAWELLTAKRLYRGSEREQLKLRNANYEQTPPSSYNHWVPQEIDALLSIALADSPAQRWPSAGAMLDALRPQLRKHGEGASRRAVLAWMQRLYQGEKVQMESRTGIHDSAPGKARVSKQKTGVPPDTQQAAFNAVTTAISAPRPVKFKPDITTVHDLGYDPIKVHQASEGGSSFALGSSEFPLQVDLVQEEEEQTSSDVEGPPCDELTANSLQENQNNS